MREFRVLLTRREIAGLGLLLAALVVAWQQWVHVAVFDVHDHDELFVVHWLRDALLAVPPAVVAVAGGVLVTRKVAERRPDFNPLVARATSTALIFSVLLIPSVGIHTAVDDALGGSGGLGSIEPAPGAGYLLADDGGLEAASGFFGQLAHGARDAAMAMPIAAMVLLVALAAPQLWAHATRPAHAKPSGGPLMERRELFRYSGAGAAALALSSSGLTVLSVRKAHAAEPGEAIPWLSDDIELVMRDGIINMIDGTPVYHYGWGFRSGGLDERESLHVPGPVLWSNADDVIEVTVTNDLDAPHSFFIEGVVDSGPIQPGDSVTVTFDAPEAGTYMYQDGINRPVNRTLGLHGVLIVMPDDGSLRSSPDLDSQYWTFVTQWVWLFNSIDPAFNARAQANRSIDPDDFIANFKPRYFTINGRTGSIAAHEETAPDTVVIDEVGNAALIRMVNAGVAMNGPHIHGNHCYVIGQDGEVPQNIMWKDTFRLMPEGRTDLFLPFNIPPNAVHFPPPESGRKFLKELHGKDTEGTWPMHCHIEMSQTAGGGLYPQGALTDWKEKI